MRKHSNAIALCVAGLPVAATAQTFTDGFDLNHNVGGWAGDLENFRPGVDWNDVVTNVDRVEIWWNHPAFFAIFAQWNVGMDNISITTEPVNACVADTDGDGEVGINDFLDLLAAWGTDNPIYDIVPDGNVGIDDFLALLAAWGPC